jgi:hypothetical protein
MCAISSARRLSKEATRKPANDDELPLKAKPLQLLTKVEQEISEDLTQRRSRAKEITTKAQRAQSNSK